MDRERKTSKQGLGMSSLAGQQEATQDQQEATQDLFTVSRLCPAAIPLGFQQLFNGTRLRSWLGSALEIQSRAHQQAVPQAHKDMHSFRGNRS